MITVDQVTIDAESTDVATRVTFSTGDATPITIRLGDEDDGFIAGDFIEFVNEGPATVTFDVKGFTATVTMDQGTSPPVLPPRRRAVAYCRGPNDYQWDIVSHQGNNQTTAFVFQVGVPAAGHVHTVPMTLQQVHDLIQGTSSVVPVADPSQPSVILTAYPNSNPGNPLHVHELEVYFDYVNHTFVVTNISNNISDNHEAFLIGDGVGGAGVPDTLIFAMEMGSASFSGNLYSDWQFVNRIDVSPSSQVSFDSYTGEFSVFTAGLYEVIVTGHLEPSGGAQLPNGVISYGVELQPFNAGAVGHATTWHTMYTDNGNYGNTSEPASLARNHITIQERFMVGFYDDTGRVKPYLYSHSYNNTLMPLYAKVTISFKRVGDYTV